MGVAVATHKAEGRATQLTFLGIQVDTETISLSLPDDKLTCILGLVLSWRSRKTGSRRELQYLIGHLNHAEMVVLAGRTLRQRMIEDGKTPEAPCQTDS